MIADCRSIDPIPQYCFPSTKVLIFTKGANGPRRATLDSSLALGYNAGLSDFEWPLLSMLEADPVGDRAPGKRLGPSKGFRCDDPYFPCR